MSLNLERLRQAVARGPFVRVLVAGVKGSAPREAGAEMLVWPDRTEGTIGGGQLEFEAIAQARRLAAPRLDRIALGPAMGQCCGGAVVLAYEPMDAQSLEKIRGPLHARPLDGAQDMPLAVRRALAGARKQGQAQPQVLEGWLLEPLCVAARPLWVWGAGHVGRAIVNVMAPLPGWDIRWLDTAPERFPAPLPAGVCPSPGADLPAFVAQAPGHARHLVLTFSHALDLELCHRLLSHGFAGLGLIGSATKWARFQRRLHDLGHSSAQISRIACPIGDPSLGKAPQAIAISVASALLKEESATEAALAPTKEGRAG